MFMLGNFILALARLLDMVLQAYIWVVIARAVISWVNADPYNPIVRFLVQVTDPVLARIRRYLPPMKNGLDLAPLLLILALAFLQFFLVQNLIEIGTRLR